MERAGPDGPLFLKPVTAGVSWKRRVKRTERARTENLGPKGRPHAPVGGEADAEVVADVVVQPPVADGDVMDAVRQQGAGLLDARLQFRGDGGLDFLGKIEAVFQAVRYIAFGEDCLHLRPSPMP